MRQNIEHLLAVVHAAAGRDHVAEHDLLALVVQLVVVEETAALRGSSMVQPVKQRATSVTSFCV